MKFLRSRRRRVGPAPPPRDEKAYLLLEESRLRCLGLREEAPWRDGAQALGTAYRELGLAGFMASNCIPSNRRLSLLAEAYERCGRPPIGGHGVWGLMQVTGAAAAAVEHALIAPGITDHLQTASEHLIRARLALVDVLAPAAAAEAVHG